MPGLNQIHVNTLYIDVVSVIRLVLREWKSLNVASLKRWLDLLLLFII